MTTLDLTTRRDLELTIRAVPDTRGGETGATTGRTFTGIGVPYGQTIDLGWGLREQFEPGAIDLARDDVPTLILWRHDEPIGRVTAGHDTDDGFQITGELSDTSQARDAATLLRDGVITRLSIGFQPEEYRVIDNGDDTETIIHTKVRALEFSLVPFPAYSQAAISDVRTAPTTTITTERPTPMTRTDALTRADLEPLETSVQDLDRKIRSLGDLTAPSLPAEPRYRSVGAYLKAVATCGTDEEATALMREFTGQTTDGSIKSETYLGEFIKWVQDRRALINLFDSGALPAKGMSVEYAQLTANTLTAGLQSAEGANLPGPGKVTLATTSAPVTTYGGWTELSRQVIERSEVPYLDTVMKALGLAYIKATNAAMRAKIVETIQGQAASAITMPASTIFDWRDVIIDAAAQYTDNGFNLEGMLVSVDQYKALQRLTYAEVPALTVRAGDEFSGTLNLPTGSGDLASVPVRCMFGEVPTKTISFYDSSALKTLESANAPLQLQDDNIINLSRAFSLYGYLSIITPFPTAIVPVTPAA